MERQLKYPPRISISLQDQHTQTRGWRTYQEKTERGKRSWPLAAPPSFMCNNDRGKYGTSMHHEDGHCWNPYFIHSAVRQCSWQMKCHWGCRHRPRVESMDVYVRWSWKPEPRSSSKIHISVARVSGNSDISLFLVLSRMFSSCMMLRCRTRSLAIVPVRFHGTRFSSDSDPSFSKAQVEIWRPT